MHSAIETRRFRLHVGQYLVIRSGRHLNAVTLLLFIIVIFSQDNVRFEETMETEVPKA